jgi:hypothetical protein
VILRYVTLFSTRCLWAALAVLGAYSVTASESLLWAGTSLAPQTASDSGDGERDAGPQLRLGDPSRSRDRDARVPLVFTPRRGEPAGTIRVELTLPSGPWKFDRAEAPPRSGWKVSARQRRQSATLTTIELNVSADNKAVPEGLVGYLRFRLEQRDSPLPSGITVGELETEPPAIEVVAPGSPGGFPGLSNDPSLNPTVTCFIFSH